MKAANRAVARKYAPGTSREDKLTDLLRWAADRLSNPSRGVPPLKVANTIKAELAGFAREDEHLAHWEATPPCYPHTAGKRCDCPCHEGREAERMTP